VSQRKSAGTNVGPKVVAAFGSVLMGVGLIASTTLLITSPAGAKSHKKANSSCSAYKAGKNGVIRTFCSGSATATVTAAGTTTVIKGGTCGRSGNYFTVNVGVVVGSSYKGSKPNYFGLDVPPTATSFTNGILSYAVGGAGGYATSNSGTVGSNRKSGTFSGTDLQGNAVSGSFTC
jgi:hypothetical protein